MENKRLNRKKINPAIPIFTGTQQVDQMAMQLVSYNSDTLTEDTKFSEDKFDGFTLNNLQHWLNIHGIHDVNRVKKICSTLDIHDLAIQDILDVNQRPKFQEYNDYWLFSMKSITPASNANIEQEQISFILGKNYLVSFQEKKGDYFNHIRKRLRGDMGIIRTRGADYLLYLLLESLLDNFFKTVTNIDKEIENFGILDVKKDPSPLIIKAIENHKRHIHQIKKTVIPIRDFISKFEREKFSLISEKHIKYFYELKDICLSLIDDCEQIEVKLDSNTNLFFSIQGHRMNQVMKTLTVVSTIFIPLTFIAGIYGMNFINIPELNWKWGYFAVWGVMILILIGMLFYFRKKKWF